MSGTIRLTAAQALVRFLAAQHVERDGRRERFFAGCFGIFGHGNLSGMGQALKQHADLLPYHQARNEQAMVHVASGYARQLNRLGTFACTNKGEMGDSSFSNRLLQTYPALEQLRQATFHWLLQVAMDISTP